MKKIDHNFAPKGYRAIVSPTDGCTGCAFWVCMDCKTSFRKCDPNCERPDGHSVIYVKKARPKPRFNMAAVLRRLNALREVRCYHHNAVGNVEWPYIKKVIRWIESKGKKA
jgi:hypothetical protein